MTKGDYSQVPKRNIKLNLGLIRKKNVSQNPSGNDLEKIVEQTPVESIQPEQILPEQTSQPELVQSPVSQPIEEKIEATPLVDPSVESKTSFNPEDNLITVDSSQISSNNPSKKYFDFNKLIPNTSKVKSRFNNLYSSIRKNGRKILYTAAAIGILGTAALLLNKDDTDNVLPVNSLPNKTILANTPDKSSQSIIPGTNNSLDTLLPGSKIFDFINYLRLQDSIDDAKANDTLSLPPMVVPFLPGIVPDVDSIYSKHDVKIIRKYTSVKTVKISPNSKKFGWHFVKEEYGLKDNRDIAKKVNEVAKYNKEHNNRQPYALVDNRSVVKTPNGFKTLKQKDGIMLDLLYAGELMLPVSKSDSVNLTYYTDKANNNYVKEGDEFKKISKDNLEKIIAEQAGSNISGEYTYIVSDTNVAAKTTVVNNLSVKSKIVPKKVVEKKTYEKDTIVIPMDTTATHAIVDTANNVLTPSYSLDSANRMLPAVTTPVVGIDSSTLKVIIDTLSTPTIQDTITKSINQSYVRDTATQDTNRYLPAVIDSTNRLLPIVADSANIQLNDTNNVIEADSMQSNNTQLNNTQQLNLTPINATSYKVDTTALKLNNLTKDITYLKTKRDSLESLTDLSEEKRLLNAIYLGSVKRTLEIKSNELFNMEGAENYARYNGEFMHVDSIAAIKARQKASKVVSGDSIKVDSLTKIVNPIETNFDTLYNKNSNISDTLKTKITGYYMNNKDNLTNTLVNLSESKDMWNNSFATGYNYKKLQYNSRKEELLGVILDTYMNHTVKDTVQKLGISKYQLYKTLDTQFGEFNGFRKRDVSKYISEKYKVGRNANSSIDNLLIA